MLDLLQPFTEGLEKTRFIFLNSDKLGVTQSMKLSKNNLLMRNFPRLPPMREEILWQKIPRVSKVSSVPNQEKTTMCSLIIRKTPIVKFVRRQKQHGPGVE